MNVLNIFLGVIFHFYKQYRQYNTVTQQNIANTILPFPPSWYIYLCIELIPISQVITYEMVMIRAPDNVLFWWSYFPLFSGNIRRVWRYQTGNQNPYIEEQQTTQWPKEKLQKDNQRSTKFTHKTKDRVTLLAPVVLI